MVSGSSVDAGSFPMDSSSLDTSFSSLQQSELCSPGQAATVSKAATGIRLFDPRAPGAHAGAIRIPGGQGLTLVGPFSKASTFRPPAVILTAPQSLVRPVTAAPELAFTEPPITPQATVTRTARRPHSSLSPPPVPKKMGRPLLGDTVRAGKERMADLRKKKVEEQEKSKVEEQEKSKAVEKVVEEVMGEMVIEVATAVVEEEEMEIEANNLVAATEIEDMEEEKESSSFTPETPWGKMAKTTFYRKKKSLVALLLKFPVQEQLELVMSVAGLASLPRQRCPIRPNKTRFSISATHLSQFFEGK